MTDKNEQRVWMRTDDGRNAIPEVDTRLPVTLTLFGWTLTADGVDGTGWTGETEHYTLRVEQQRNICVARLTFRMYGKDSARNDTEYVEVSDFYVVHAIRDVLNLGGLRWQYVQPPIPGMVPAARGTLARIVDERVVKRPPKRATRVV